MLDNVVNKFMLHSNVHLADAFIQSDLQMQTMCSNFKDVMRCGTELLVWCATALRLVVFK